MVGIAHPLRSIAQWASFVVIARLRDLPRDVARSTSVAFSSAFTGIERMNVDIFPETW
jgi:hypothetical protein